MVTLALQPQLSRPAGYQGGEVAGDGAAGREVRRADDVDQLLAGHPRPPDYRRTASMILVGLNGGLRPSR